MNESLIIFSQKSKAIFGTRHPGLLPMQYKGIAP